MVENMSTAGKQRIRGRLVVEFLWPYVLAGASLWPIWHYLTDAKRLIVVVDLVNPILGLIGLFIGSVIASLSILLTAKDNRSVAWLKGTRQERLLINYHSEMFVVGCIACVLSLLVLVCCKIVNTPNSQPVFNATTLGYTLFHGWVLFTVASLTTFVRLAVILRNMILVSIQAPPPPRPYTRPSSPQVTEVIEEVVSVG
jgi:hypothetical protein